MEASVGGSTVIPKGASPVRFSYDPRFPACLARQNRALFVLPAFQKVQFSSAIKGVIV